MSDHSEKSYTNLANICVKFRITYSGIIAWVITMAVQIWIPAMPQSDQI